MLIIVLGVGLVWHYSTRTVDRAHETENTQSVKVVTTFYPLQELAKSVVGDMGEVLSIVPGGMEPHDFEPTPRDIKAMYSADLVVVNGAGMDPWAEKLIPELEAKQVSVIVLAKSVDLLTGEAHHHGDEDEHEHGDEHASMEMHDDSEGVHSDVSSSDPHFWLDPIIALGLVDQIEKVLTYRYPDLQDRLEVNSKETRSRLQAIDATYRSGLATCEKNEVVTSHNAFAYLAKRYGFETHALAGLSPEAEPSAKRLADIAAEVREEGIKYIFFETLVSPKLAETLAKETGAGTLVFNPIEGVTAEEKAAGATYFSLMESNLVSLRKALECK